MRNIVEISSPKQEKIIKRLYENGFVPNTFITFNPGQTNILAKISDFKDWNDLLRSSDAKREIGALKLNCYKIGMDSNIISSASMLVHHELFAEFVDKNGDVNCTDEEELHVWKSIMERLLF